MRDDLALVGTAGNDSLKGDLIDAGSYDSLSGLAGDDILQGLGGNDTLLGGLGKDGLVGGSGADTFVYRTKADSTLAQAGRDVIADFNRAEGDKIDVHAIDANPTKMGGQAWSFVSAFTGAAGQISFDAAQHLPVFDQDGDKAADFAIELTGVSSLAAGDFIIFGISI